MDRELERLDTRRQLAEQRQWEKERQRWLAKPIIPDGEKE